MNAKLPDGLRAYKRTPTFDEITLPAGLRRPHPTKRGVWAPTHVTAGAIKFRTFDPASETIIAAGDAGIVQPEQAHEVEPMGAMKMYVEFYAGEERTGEPS